MPPQPTREHRRRFRVSALMVLAAASVPAGSAHGQGAAATVLGGVGGFVAGEVVAVGVATARARITDEYLYSASDVVGWAATPVVVGLGAGLIMGATDDDALARAGIGSGVGAVVGAGIGALLGGRSWNDPQNRWAGGVIGASAGIVLGAVVGGLWPSDEDPLVAEGEAARSPPSGVAVTFRIPVS